MKSVSHLAALGCITTLLTACGGGADPSSSTASVQLARMGGAGDAPIVASPIPVYAYEKVLQHLYLAYLGRPADPNGLAYWNNYLLQHNAPLTDAELFRSDAGQQMIGLFLDGNESRSLYFGNNAEFINSIYQTLLNRDADPAGIAYWADLLDRGVITRSEAASSLLLGVQGNDLLLLTKKTQIASQFTSAVITNGAVLMYWGAAASEVARSLMAQVTSATDVDAFKQQVEAEIARMLRIGPDIGLPTVARYAGFNFLQNINAGSPYTARLSYSYGNFFGRLQGSLTFGQTTVQVSAYKDSSTLVFDAPISYAALVGKSVNGQTPLQAPLIMLCQPVAGTGGARGKSTDILVDGVSTMLTSAQQLAGQTLAFYREDCALPGELSSALNPADGTQRYVFDAAGNATVTTPSGTVSYSAAMMTALLNGKAIPDAANQNFIALRAYRYTRPDQTLGYAIVSHAASSYFNPSTGVLGLWSQE